MADIKLNSTISEPLSVTEEPTIEAPVEDKKKGGTMKLIIGLPRLMQLRFHQIYYRLLGAIIFLKKTTDST